MLFGVASVRRTFRQLRDGVGRVDVFRRLRFFGRGYRKSGNSRLDQTDDQLFMLDVWWVERHLGGLDTNFKLYQVTWWKSRTQYWWYDAKTVKYQEITIRSWIVKMLFQAFVMPDHINNTWQIRATCYKYIKLVKLNGTRQTYTIPNNYLTTLNNTSWVTLNKKWKKETGLSVGWLFSDANIMANGWQSYSRWHWGMLKGKNCKQIEA